MTSWFSDVETRRGSEDGYSTTRGLRAAAPVLPAADGAAVRRALQLPAHPRRSGDGGLRTRGHFKADSAAKPLMTIITVVFNAAPTLEATILSVLHQDYDNVEFIIVDGGSTDGSVALLRKYEHAIDYWVSEPDKGIFDAWNKSLALSTGQWIAFLGADDMYLEGALASYARVIGEQRERALDYISSRVNLTRQGKTVRVIGQCWNWAAFGKYMNVAHVGSMHHWRLFERWGGYDPAYRICGDYELLLRPRAALRAAYFDMQTVNMSIGGVSDNNWRALQEMTRAKIETGGRNRLLSMLELSIALVKWRIRRWIWY